MELTFEEFGTGDAILLIHGLGGTGNVWGPQATLLARYFRVIVPDLRGAGRSVGPGEISVATLVGDVLELLDRLDVKLLHVVGHSFGSVVAQHLTVQQPQRVRSLGLVGPIRAPSEMTVKALRDRAALARKEGLIGIANTTVQVGTSAATKAARPEVVAFVRELVMRQDPARYAETCEALAAVQPAALETITCPTLVVTGDEDAISPPAAAKAIADAIPGSRYVILPRCGHWIPLEQAADLTAALMNFLFQRA